MKTYNDAIKKYRDTNYMKDMKDSIKNGDVPGAAGLNITRNEKIDALNMPYKKLNTNDVYELARKTYPKALSTPGQRIPSQHIINWDALKADVKAPAVPDVPVVAKTAEGASNPMVGMPAVLKGKDLSVDYMQSAIDKAKAGDYAGAAYDEMMHNEKNGYLGLGYANSHIFNYDDPYRGDLDRQREAIEKRDPFSYDYREDDLYKSILALKEKEADKAYKDGYAQLTRQFDGDIPVNMINKLLTTKSEIVDQADSYIPQLRELAYQMYSDEGNKMLNDYNITRDLAADDYSKWLSDRDFVVSGMENKYARDRYDEEFEYNKYADNRYNEYLMKSLEQELVKLDKEQNWTSDENALDRAHETQIQNDDQTWRSGESALDRSHETQIQNDDQTWRSGESALDRAHETQLQNDDQTWRSGESALDRSHDLSIQTNNQAYNSGVNAQGQKTDTENLIIDTALKLYATGNFSWEEALDAASSVKSI